MGVEDGRLEEVLKLLESLSKGTKGGEFLAQCMMGLQVLQVKKGLLRCGFLVTDRVSDENGNWEVGAMTSLMDVVGFCAALTLVPAHSAIELSISCISTPKINEKVEIEAKVVGEKEKLTSAVVETRRKATNELIALGRLWMVSNIVTRKI
ncbi:hypothetical protein RJ641_024140 [Dillenia turbinata]|uniref:Thioesterase domain-containing protein n=1 Tax=Dillenia turbinata TaxID=194707 RepID=A0AAN8YTF2_9MAGN